MKTSFTILFLLLGQAAARDRRCKCDVQNKAIGWTYYDADGGAWKTCAGNVNAKKDAVRYCYSQGSTTCPTNDRADYKVHCKRV